MIETYHIGKYVKYNIHCVNSIEEIEKRRDMFWVMNIHDENVHLRIDSDKQGKYTWIWLIVYSDGWYKETEYDEQCILVNVYTGIGKLWRYKSGK